MQSVFQITKKELYKLFIKQNKSRKEIAKYYGCSEVLVKKKCQLFNIKKPFVFRQWSNHFFIFTKFCLELTCEQFFRSRSS